MRDAGRVRLLCAPLAIALLAAGCSGSGGGSAAGDPPGMDGTTPATSPSRTPTIPNPFTITARYSAGSLRLEHPVDLAIGPDGDLYVTDRSQRVAVVSPSGEVLRSWGTKGSGRAQFDFVSNDPSDPNDVHASIAVGPDGEVYVADSGNDRVEVFAASGRYIRQFGGPGVGPGQFLAAFDLAVDAEGSVYVADDGAMTLSKFSPSGRFEWSVGGATTRDPDLLGYFHSHVVDAHGRVVVAVEEARTVVFLDAGGHKVDEFSVAGAFPNGSDPCHLSVDRAGETVVQSCPAGPRSNGDTLVFDRTHQLIGGWYGSPVDTNAPPTFGMGGDAFALGPDGAILRLKVTLPDG